MSVSKRGDVSYFHRPGGVRIGYIVLGKEHLGSKPPLIVLNALGMIPEDWDRLTPELTKSRPVMFFDYRGFNMSHFEPGMTQAEFTFHLLLDDCKGLIKHMGWRVIDLLIWSMGTAFGHALLADDEIKQMVEIRHCIISSSGPQYPLNAELQYFSSVLYMFNTQSSCNGNVTSEENKNIIRDGLQFYFNPSFMSSPQVARWIRNFCNGDRNSNIIFQIGGAFVKNGNSLHLLPFFAKNCKILVIQGELDRIIPMGDVECYFSLPQARPLRVGNGRGKVPDLKFGHCWMEYHTPQIWASVINDFLDDIEPTS